MEKTNKKQELMKYLKSLTPEQRTEIANKYGFLSVEGHQYSPTNQILIVSQLKDINTTILAGFKQWNKAGRFVKKGEHGASIFINCNKKNEEDNIESYFIMSTVFDISQTDLFEVQNEK